MREKLENYFARLWYGTKKPNLILRSLSNIYDLIRKRNELSSKTIGLSLSELKVPVVVVGNISVGGTGKTPLVLFLINELTKINHKVGVISRGYGGTLSKHEVVILDEHSTASFVGDEAFMLYKKTHVPFCVGVDRVKAAESLTEKHPDVTVIISDDGLQHYRLQRSVEIVVVDGERGFGNSLLLPAGPLREPLTRLSDIDLVLCNGPVKHATLKEVPALSFDLQATGFHKLNKPNESVALDSFKSKTVEAFAGIGNPERFFSLLESLGLNVNRHQLADHGLMPKEFFMQNKDKIVIMTEKDAVKYPNKVSDNFWYLPVNVVMSIENTSKLLDVLHNKL